MNKIKEAGDWGGPFFFLFLPFFLSVPCKDRRGIQAGQKASKTSFSFFLQTPRISRDPLHPSHPLRPTNCWEKRTIWRGRERRRRSLWGGVGGSSASSHARENRRRKFSCWRLGPVPAGGCQRRRLGRKATLPVSSVVSKADAGKLRLRGRSSSVRRRILLRQQLGASESP